MNGISSREYNSWQAKKEAEYGFPISTITNRPAPTPEEEFSSRAGLISSLAENYGLLWAPPGVDAGVVYPANIARTIPESTRRLASYGRRLMYKELKQDVKDRMKNPDAFKTFLENIGLSKDRSLQRGLKTYRENVKATTSIPDPIVARIKDVFAEGDKHTLGSWREYLTKPTVDKGGDMAISPHSIGQVNTIQHEGAHAAHGVASKIYEAARTDPKARKLWNKIPEKTKEAITDIATIDKFHRKWYGDVNNPTARQRYQDNYDIWPAERLAQAAPDINAGLVSRLGRRPTVEEYFEALGPVAKKLVPETKKLNKQFKLEDKEMKNLVDAFYDFDLK